MAPRKKRPFADQIVAGKGHLIHKIKAKDTTGQWAFYFVLVEPLREQAFLKALENKTVSDLSAYGNIIASCYGETPSDEIRDYLKEKYNFEI